MIRNAHNNAVSVRGVRLVVALVAVGVMMMSGAVSGVGTPDLRAAPESATNAAGDTSGHPFTNRLAGSDSPYLLLHAHNPVDWYPWGAEAFEKARREGKPIFLSIGYSTCFWCHVAERTIYLNPGIAKLMNQWFVNVKVDREQRPDIDQIYMLATRVLTGAGGWPNNVFLTPDLRPFFAGSYFPPADDPVRGTGFPTILRTVHDAWVGDQTRVVQIALSVDDAMRRMQRQMAAPAATQIQPDRWMRAARDSLLAQVDAENGGLGAAGGPKFPRTPELALLLSDFRLHGNATARAAVTQTLDAMAFGGIHDQVAGGFHRYSTEPTWSVPHFEKMLYDNAQLLQLYAESFELTGNSLHRQMAFDIGRYLMREMTSPDAPGFFTAQDAQIDGVEGAGYLWTQSDIASVLGKGPAERFFQVYELVPLSPLGASGAVEAQQRGAEQLGVLRIRLPIDRTLKQSGFADAAAMIASLYRERAALLATRNQRPQPARDDKIIVGLNGLTIRGFVVAGRVLHEPQFTALAQRVGERIWALAYDSKARSLQHAIFRGRTHSEGFLQDYADLGVAFMSLASATGNTMWRDRAALVAGIILERFVREDGSLAMTADSKQLLVPVTDEGDSDVPSGTSTAIELLLQLAATSPTGESQYSSAARRVVGRLSGALQQYPSAWASAVTALNVHAMPDAGASGSRLAAQIPPITAPKDLQLPATSDHVHVSATAEEAPLSDRILITVAVDKGYHINANPASFDFLIPTSVKFAGLRSPEVAYPAPVRFKSTFAPEALNVYEGAVKLIASFPKDTLPKRETLRGVVTAQACDARVCLPPSDVPFSIAVAGR